MLLCNEKYKSAGFFSLILLGAHLVVGLWVLLVFIFIFLLSSNLKILKNYEFKKIFLGILFGSIPILISLIFFKINTIDPTSYITNDFNIYMNNWDHHRNINTINYNYISKTLILLIILTIYFFKLKSEKKFVFYFFIIFSCIGSMFIYLSLKLFPEYISPLILRAMPTVFLSHSVIGYPISGCLYLYIKQLKFTNIFNYKFSLTLFFSTFY